MRTGVTQRAMKNMVKMMLTGSGFFICSALAATADPDKGRIDFQGRVSDVSCSVALNGSDNAGSGVVWLAPVSLSEVNQQGAGAFIKPQAMNFELSKCQLSHSSSAGADITLPVVTVRWVSGGGATEDEQGHRDYLANVLDDGARNIYLALSTSNDRMLEDGNKVVPADPQQPRAQIRGNALDGGLFTYYIGYVTQSPRQVTSGPIRSLATLELVYN